jgi:3-phosphoshikimate 1-carboxyvinyltransferase
MNALPDAALALAVVALFAVGPTRIRNVANLRLKETDRRRARTELAKLGAPPAPLTCDRARAATQP